MDLVTMKRKKLQELCKKHGVPANLTNREMANRLASLLQNQKPEEPISRGRSSSNNVEEIDSETDPKVAQPKVKKVRFSPNNETHIIVCSDTESAASEKRNGRQPRKRNDTKIAGSPLRRRKSSIRTSAQADKEDVAQVLSPPFGKRRSERWNSSVQNENAHNMEIVASNMRQLRSRAVVVERNGEVVDGNAGENGTKIDLKRRKRHGDGLSETGNQDMPTERTQGRTLTRQSRRNTEKDIDSKLPVIESEKIENSRRVTRSSFQPVQEAAVVNANAAVVNANAAVVNANNLQEEGIQGERVKNSQTRELPKRPGRKTGKSIAPSKVLPLPNEIVALQNTNEVAERVIDVGNTRRSKRNKTRGRESPILSNEIAPESEIMVPNSQHYGDNASIHESKRGGARTLEEQKMRDQSGNASKGLGLIDSHLVEGDVYAIPEDDEGDGYLNDKKSSKRANRVVYERRTLEPEANSASVNELPLRRSRRLTTVLQGKLPTEQPRHSKRNPSRRVSFAVLKKQKSTSRNHPAGDMTSPHRSPTVEELLELNAMSPVQEVLEHENNNVGTKEIPDNSNRKEDEEETAAERELQPVKGKQDMANPSTASVDVSSKPSSPDERDQREICLDVDGAPTNSQPPQVLHNASGQDEEASAELESIKRLNKVNGVISQTVPFSAERSNNMTELSVEPVACAKGLENELFLSGEDKYSTEFKVLEDQFDDLKGTRNVDGNSVETVDAADFNNLSPQENKNITCDLGMRHMKSEYGHRSSNTAAEVAITQSNTSDNSQQTVHRSSEEKTRREAHSSGYSSISPAGGTPHMEENDRQNLWDTLCCEDETAAGENVNESQQKFQPPEASVKGRTVVSDEKSCQMSQEDEGGALEVELESTSKDTKKENLEDISVIFPGEYTDMIGKHKGKTVLFDEKGSKISQKEENRALQVELESTFKDTEQESLDDIGVVSPGEYTDMVEKYKVSMQFEGLDSEKHVHSYERTAEEVNKHEDGWTRLNAIEFNGCSMSISHDVAEEGFYGQEKDIDLAKSTKAESAVSHATHPMHHQDNNGDTSVKKEDLKERASDVPDLLSFSPDDIEDNVQGTAVTQHCLETLDCDNYLDKLFESSRSGLKSACKETKCAVAYEILSKDATRAVSPEKTSQVQGAQTGKVDGNSGQPERIQAHNSAAMRLDRCSLLSVTVESERCSTDRVFTETDDMIGGTVDETHEDIEDYSTNNHDMEFPKSEGVMHLRLSNVTPFSCPKGFRDLGGVDDDEAPSQRNEEKRCNFDCQEDEDIQLDQHKCMYSHGLSCIETRTRSAETSDGNPDGNIGSVGNNYVTEGDESESSEQSLSRDSGNPNIEDSVDANNSDMALDRTGNARYESDDMVRIEQDIEPRKIDQSLVTGGEDPMPLHELNSDFKGQCSTEGCLLADRSEKIGTGDQYKAPNEDTISDNTGKKDESGDELHIDKLFPEDECNGKEVLCEEGAKEQFLVRKVAQKQTLSSHGLNVSSPVDSFHMEGDNDCVMTPNIHSPSKLDGLSDSDSNPNHITCNADCLLKQGSTTGLFAFSSAETSSIEETKVVEDHHDESHMVTSSFSGHSQLNDLRKMIEVTCQNRLEDKNGGGGGDVAVWKSEKNAPLFAEGREDECKHMESLEEHEKELQDINTGDCDDEVALAFEENALLVAKGSEDEHKNIKAGESVVSIAPLDGFISGDELKEHEIRLPDTNAGNGGAVALEFEENALLVAEELEVGCKYKKDKESANTIAPSDGLMSRDKHCEKRFQDTSAGDGGGTLELKENALLAVEGLVHGHKHEKAVSADLIVPIDGFIIGEKLEEHEKILQNKNIEDSGDVRELEFEENDHFVAEAPEDEHKYKDSVDSAAPSDGFESGEGLKGQEKRLQDMDAGDDGGEVSWDFVENAPLVVVEHDKRLQTTSAGNSGGVVSLELKQNALLAAEGLKDEHKKADGSADLIMPLYGIFTGEKLEEREKTLPETNAGNSGHVAGLEFEEIAHLAAEGLKDEHKKAEDTVGSAAPSDGFVSGPNLEKESNNFRNDEKKCPEVSGSKDAGGLMKQESGEMTTLTGESDLNFGMLSVEETEVRLGTATRADARGTTSGVIKFDNFASLGAEDRWEEHRSEEKVTEDIGSIKNSVDVLDVGDRKGSREQDDICAMIQEYMDLELRKADSGEIFVSKDIEVHDGCGSYNAPRGKPFLEAEPNESREEIVDHYPGGDSSILRDGDVKHSFEQTSHLPTICIENASDDLAAMNSSATNADNVAQKASMKKPKFSSYQKNRSETNPDERKRVALLMKSATVRRVQSRGNIIDKTPKKLFSTFEMKENMPSTKKEQIGSTTATKTLTKRRALEDLQKKQIWK